jgi:cell wall-associated NlpC family hydrolase
MFAVRGRTVAPDRAAGARATAALALVASILVATFFATPARADRIQEKRAEAAAALTHLQGMQRDLEIVIQKYDQARQRLQDTQGRIDENEARLKVARANLNLALADLEGSMIAAYKSGRPDMLQTVLASHSLSSMLDQVDLYHRANRYNASVLERVRVYKREVVQRKRQLAVEKKHRQSAVAEQSRRRTAVRAGIRAQNAYLAGLHREIRQLVRERQEALRRAALARAEAARRALAQARQQQQVSLNSGIGGATPVSSTSVDTSSVDTSSSDGGGGDTTTVTIAPPASNLGASAAQYALGEQGVPYVWGGSSPSGFDCSGLVVWAYAQAGYGGLPHYTGSLWSAGVHVSSGDLAPGDLVFFHGLSHVGIYIGGGQFVHAPHTGDVVKVSSLSDPWYSSGFEGGVRITG